MFIKNVGEGSKLTLRELVTQAHCCKYFGNDICLNYPGLQGVGPKQMCHYTPTHVSSSHTKLAGFHPTVKE